jgi:DNA repair protein RadC
MVPSTRYAYGYRVTRIGEEPAPSVKCDQPDIVAKYWADVIEKLSWYDPDKEHLVVLMLNTKYAVKGYSVVSVGSLNEAIAQPREIFRAAVASAAYGIVMIHNHPSGDPSPSQADHSLTRRIIQAADILGIKLIDHVVVGKPDPEQFDNARRTGRFSFKEAGVV